MTTGHDGPISPHAGSRTKGRTPETSWRPGRPLFLLAALLVASCAPSPPGGSEAGEAHADPFPYSPEGATPPELGIAGFAKVTCSAVFVSGRDVDEAMENSGFFFLAPEHRGRVTDTVVDRDRGLVSLTWDDTVTRTAVHYGDQGCVLRPPGVDTIYFEPTPVEHSLPPGDETPWPMGDLLSDEPLPAEIDSVALAAAVDAAFADPAGLTAAFLVVWRGRIIAERYALGAELDTQLESWSMGKSLTATLVGILIEEGAFGLHDPAPVPAWRTPGDPRSEIRISDLLRMSSGLFFTAPRDPDYDPALGYPDHMRVYSGALDAFAFSVDRPLQFEPGTEGRYRNSDPLTLGYLVRTTVEEGGENYWTWPQRALFDRIGIRRQVLEPDPYGNFLLTGYDYGTARNWARLGLLYLNDGVWRGERILPEGFVDFVSTPAPAWDEPVYGGLFWINGTGEWQLPRDAYFMAGGGGQRTFVVPGHDLVVVRMGHFRGADPGMAALNEALGLLMEAIPEAGTRETP